MHDPDTIAFEIRYPWAASRRTLKDGTVHTYREPFVTIWHRDPERDGTDDSCGWSRPHLTRRQMDRLKALAWSEARNPHFLRHRGRSWTAPQVEAEALYRGLVLHVAECIGVKMTFDEAARWAAMAIHRPDCTPAADRLCFEPGYHSNFTEDRRKDREQHFLDIACTLARSILAARRPWWRHPRWHVWHWRIQIHPWQKLRRWLFVRCGECGGRFGWNESAVTYSWTGQGPRFHDRCTEQYERRQAAERLIRETSAPPAHT